MILLEMVRIKLLPTISKKKVVCVYIYIYIYIYTYIKLLLPAIKDQTVSYSPSHCAQIAIKQSKIHEAVFSELGKGASEL